jgi:predicted GH43/DUF377 family glycosyl hydrolase
MHKKVVYDEIVQLISSINIAADTKLINGSILELSNNNYLIAYRNNINMYQANYHTEIKVAELDQNMKVLRHNTLDFTKAAGSTHRNKITAQDPRLFTVANQLYMIYNEAVPRSQQRELYLAAINFSKSIIEINSLAKLHYAPEPNLTQKNWVPFTHQNNLFFIYSFQPYRILNFDFNTKRLMLTHNCDYNLNKLWHYGEIRGGTPAIYLPELDAYLGFFHSSIARHKSKKTWAERKAPLPRDYFMGAYLFDAQPPFLLRAITTKPLAFKGLYANSKQDFHIIFPSGVVAKSDHFLVSAGVDDNKTLLLKISKKTLLTSMQKTTAPTTK